MPLGRSEQSWRKRLLSWVLRCRTVSSEALINLEACARIGDRLQYAETLALLRDLVEEIGRTEKITVKNIL